MSWFSIFRSIFKTKLTLKKVSSKDCVLITGCDSGLGFNLALLCSCKLNMTVVTGCIDLNSDGVKILKAKNQKNILPLEINLLKHETIDNAFKVIENLISEGYNLSALVNNAGIMCFGEYEWQTTEIIESQIQVNLLGTMRITKKLLPLIRRQKSRIINVTSHCGLHALPGLSPYSASKAGLRSWNDALRIEMKKYGVDVINFIPGSFVLSSNIVAKQESYANDMRKNFTDEQKHFYLEYFDAYNEYLKFISGYKTPIEMEDKDLFDKFKLALLEETPKSMYKHEPLRYKIYYALFRIFPTPLVDWLTERFISMPKYKTRIQN